MTDSLSRYLSRRADLQSRPLEGGGTEDVARVVVIPALAEYETLPETLASVAENPPGLLATTLVIVVVNNGPRTVDRHSAYEENQATLAWLRDAARRELDGVRLAWVDASSEGRELGVREGVGAARKIGLDWGLEVLRRNARPGGALINLDADALVDSAYLEVLDEYFQRDRAWGAVVELAHRLEGPREQRQAILRYELFLRYHVLGLRYAGSPYAFHTLGSIMACRGEAYAAVSGMNRRRGGEDFYFLQELAKTGQVATLSGTTVRPSARPSWRVPFGTGPRVAEQMKHPGDGLLAYAPECYEVLRAWLGCVSRGGDVDGETLQHQARAIDRELEKYLEDQDFRKTWERLQANAGDREQLLAQFHRWFDGLKTLRLIHHLRNTAYPSRPVEEVASAVGAWFDSAAPELLVCDGAEAVCTRAVARLRDLERAVL